MRRLLALALSRTRTRTLSLSLSLALAFSLVTAASAQSPPVRVFVGETQLQFDVPPYLESGRTLVPVRALAEALGFLVDFDPTEWKVILTRGDEEILLWINSDKVMVNGKEGRIDVPAALKEGRTFVPVRFVSENLGAQVGWDQENWTVLVKPASTKADQLRLVTRALEQMDKLIDQQYHGSLLIQIEMSDGLNRFTVGVASAIEGQIYQNEMLQTMTIEGMGLSDRTQFAVHKGLVYTKEGESQPWTIIAEVDASESAELLAAMAGASFLSGSEIRTELLKSSTLTWSGKEELDGVAVERYAVVAGAHETASLMSMVVEGLGMSDWTTTNMPSLDRFEATYWIEPASAFVYRVSMSLTMSGPLTDPAPMDGKVTVTADLRYKPVSEPIQFPDFTDAVR